MTQGVKLCHRWNFRQLVGILTLSLSHAQALSGQIGETVTWSEQELETARLARLIRRRSQQACNLGEIYWLKGHYENAQSLVAKAYERAHNTKQRGLSANALQILGDIAMHRNPPEIDQAKIHYHQSLNLATELGMRPLQAHCHRGLDTLYSQTGQSEQALGELSTAIDMYRDMEMTFWLSETEAALQEEEGKA